MKFLLGVLCVTLIAAVTACGSDNSTDSAGRQLPEPDGFERVLQLADSDVATPDFTLDSVDHDVVRLSDYQGEKPFAVVFYRGFF